MQQLHKATVLITINTSWNIVNFRSMLIQALKEAGYRVITAAPDDAHTEALQQLVDAHYPLPMQNAGTSVLQDGLLCWRYYQLFKREQPNAILAYTIKPNIYANFAASQLNIPVINNVSGLGTVFITQNWLTAIAKTLYRKALKRSSKVFFQNEDDRDLFLKLRLVERSKTDILPGSGINLEQFKPSASPPKHRANACDFLLIARLLWDKGIGEYVEAARLVKQTYPECRFRLLGPLGVSNKTAITEEQVKAWETEGIIEYLGERHDVREEIAVHDCVVLPSYREGMSRVLLESAAMGKPLITTDAPGCRHVVEHEKNGFLCHIRDARHLAQQMSAFIDLAPNARAQMGTYSREKAEREFDEKQVHAAYLSAISALT